MLNSRSEYDRCRIPRLVVEERDEEEIKTMEQAKVLENIKNMDREQRTWEQQRLLDKSTMSKKQLTETERGGRSKKRKFAIITEEWGEQEDKTNVDQPADLMEPPDLRKETGEQSELDPPDPPPSSTPTYADTFQDPPVPTNLMDPSTPDPPIPEESHTTIRTPPREPPHVPNNNPKGATHTPNPHPLTPTNRIRTPLRKKGSPLAKYLNGSGKRGKMPPSVAGRNIVNVELYRNKGAPPLDENTDDECQKPNPPENPPKHKTPPTPNPQPPPPPTSLKNKKNSTGKTTPSIRNFWLNIESKPGVKPPMPGGAVPKKDAPKKQERDQNTQQPPPPKGEPCKFDIKGFCKQHRLLGTKISFKKSVWKDLGGNRGFGYKKETVTKFKCGYESGGTEKHGIARWMNRSLASRKGNHENSTITIPSDAISGRDKEILPGISDQDLSGARREKVVDRITRETR